MTHFPPPLTPLTPDGKFVISRTGEIEKEFIGHTGDVWGVAVSPDSRLLVSGSADQTIRLWKVATGKPLMTLILWHGSGMGGMDA